MATIFSWLALLLARCCKNSVKPSTLITWGLILGLISAFFMMDYKSTNTFEEKRESLGQVKKKLVIGLSLTIFGYMLSTLGIEAQMRDLMRHK